MKNTKLYVVDDDPLILESLYRAFSEQGFTVETFDDSRKFIAESLTITNACVLLDLNMPYHSGQRVLSQLSARYPGLPVIVYTGKADVISAVQAMEDGALTLIQKPASFEHLLEKVSRAISESQARLKLLDSANKARAKMSTLTERELAVARLVSEGLSANNIAEQLFISSRTVEAHKSNIFSKLNVNSVAALTRLVLLSEM